MDEASREAAAYNTDVESVASTISSAHSADHEFAVQEIIDENVVVRNGHREEQYLIKWKDYPIHRSDWVPLEQITGERESPAYTAWEAKRAELGERGFKKLADTNYRKFEEAQKRAERAKEIRKRKRAELRKLQRKGVARRVAPSDQKAKHERRSTSSNTGSKAKGIRESDSAFTGKDKSRRKLAIVQSSSDEAYSDDDSHSFGQAKHKVRQPRSEPKKQQRKTRIADTSSEQESSEDNTGSLKQAKGKARLLRSGQKEKQRTLPIVETSPREEPSGDDTGSLDQAKTKPRPIRSERGADKQKQSRRSSPQPKLKQSRTAASLPKSSERTPLQQEKRRSVSVVDLTADDEETAVRPQPKRGNEIGKKSTADTARRTGSTVHAASSKADPSTNKPSTTAVSAGGTARNTSTAVEQSNKPKKSAAGAGLPAPIKLLNEPKQPTRKPWASDKHFTTWHFRGLAEKRSRAEGTPDPAALDFINGNPSGLPKPVERPPRTKTNDNPYARRELGRRRVQEVDREDITQTLRATHTLQPYEVGKIPLMCFDWKYTTCPFTAEKCRFLHREKDPSGKPYKATSWDGKVPPKYAERPVTCFFWLRGNSGCEKSAEDCNFAHENTGLLGNPDKSKPVEIDKSERPGDKEEHGTGSKVATRANHPNVTCWYWLRDPNGCTRSEDECNYAHRNTGTLGNTKGRAYETIDTLERPVSGATNLRPPAPAVAPHAYTHTQPFANHGIPRRMLTCFFWKESTCTKPDCPFQHRDTGYVADPPRFWKPPPGWQPRSARVQFEEAGVPIPMDEHIPEPHSELEGQLPIPMEPSPKQSDSRSRAREEILPEITQLTYDRLPSPVPSRTDTPPITVMSTIEMKNTIEAACKLDFDEMFRCNGDEKTDVVADRRACLFFNSEEHMEEHEIFTRWLWMHHVKVFNGWSDQSWDDFKRQILDGGSGVIIVHPDFEGYSMLPGFGDVLRGQVRLWSIGFQEGAECDLWDPTSPQDRQYSRFSIFPHGGVIYITDDVFENKPQLALKIVELFFAKIEKCRQVESDVVPGMYIDDGILLWRLAVRPELMQWMGDMCLQHEAEIEAGDPNHVSREKLYILLNDSGYILPDGTDDHPADDRRLDFLPIISPRRNDTIFFYEALAHSQYEANTEMAHLYSGLVVTERRNYRQYFVVHTEPEQVDWKETITNIDEVMTPEKLIEHFEGESKGNRFDFYEWAYPEKVRADSAAA